MAKKRIPAKLQVWIDARQRYHLTHAQIQMAREVDAVPTPRDYIQDWERAPKSDGKLHKIA